MKKLYKLMGVIAVGVVIMAASAVVLAGCDTGTNSSTGSENTGGNDNGGNNAGGNNNGGNNTGGTRPSTPQGVYLETYSRPGALGGTDIFYRITWNAVTGATSYNQYRATSYSGSYTKINISPITSTTTGGFYWTYGQSGMSESWYFKISAVNSYGESGQSSIVYITPSVLGR